MVDDVVQNQLKAESNMEDKEAHEAKGATHGTNHSRTRRNLRNSRTPSENPFFPRLVVVVKNIGAINGEIEHRKFLAWRFLAGNPKKKVLCHKKCCDPP